MGQSNLPCDPEQTEEGLENGQMGKCCVIAEKLPWPGGSWYFSIWSQVKGHRSQDWPWCRGCLSANPFPPSFSFFIFCSLIYSGLNWHRGLDSACCQTKALQCTQYYSDPVSALSPMRSPQCYVSLTEKYSHTEKDAILQGEALPYWCCTDEGNIHCTHTHTESQSHIHKRGKRSCFVSIWDFSC